MKMKKTTLIVMVLCAAPAAAATFVMLPSGIVIPASYWGVADSEPMVVTHGEDRVSFSRLGDEQCMDKMLGAVPCDLETQWFEPKNESGATLLMSDAFRNASGPASTDTTPSGLPVIGYPSGGGGGDDNNDPPPLPPPPPPPPAAISIASSVNYLLGALAGLVLLSVYRKKGQA